MCVTYEQLELTLMDIQDQVTRALRLAEMMLDDEIDDLNADVYESERHEEKAFRKAQKASRREAAEKRRANEAELRVTALEEELRRLRRTGSALQDGSGYANVQPKANFAADQATAQAALYRSPAEAVSSPIADDSPTSVAPSAVHSTSKVMLPPEAAGISPDNELLLRCMLKYNIASRQERVD